jgi:hypothetical protein
MAGEPGAAVRGEGVNAEVVSTGRVHLDPQLDPLTRPDEAGRHRVAGGLETDQAVFPDPPQMLLRHQIRLLRQLSEGGSIRLGADRNHRAVGAKNLATADRQPSREGAVQLGDRVEATAGEHMVADHVHLSFHSTFSNRRVTLTRAEGFNTPTLTYTSGRTENDI